MALVNIKRQIRAGKTRLNNTKNAIADKQYEFDDALVGQPRGLAIKRRHAECRADIGKLSRALGFLTEWLGKYGEYVEELEEADMQRAEADFEQFLVDENMDAAETAG